jgi:hypothetical protein
LAVAVFWPTWEWTTHPARRWLFTSYARELSLRDSLKCRRLIEVFLDECIKQSVQRRRAIRGRKCVGRKSEQRCARCSGFQYDASIEHVPPLFSASAIGSKEWTGN